MVLVRFCLNPVSLDRKGRAISEGQAARLIAPILPHLEAAGVEYSIGAQPINGAVNCYYSHRDYYTKVARETAVFISHGIADKNWRNTTGTFYRANFVSGPSWTRRLLDHQAPAHAIFEVGYPKLDPLFQARSDRPENKRPVVVWAPTHGGGGVKYWDLAPIPENQPDTPNAWRSSWWHRDEVLELLAEFDVIEAPHPRHRADRKATFEEYVGADVVVADGGSTIYEAWALGIPVVFPSWLTMLGNTTVAAIGSMEETIYRNRIGRHALLPEMLAPLVRDAVDVGITVAEHDFIEPILPAAYRGEGGRMHAETLIDLANKEPSPRHNAPVTWARFTFAGKNRKVAIGTKDFASLERSPHWKRVPDDLLIRQRTPRRK